MFNKIKALYVAANFMPVGPNSSNMRYFAQIAGLFYFGAITAITAMLFVWLVFFNSLNANIALPPLLLVATPLLVMGWVNHAMARHYCRKAGYSFL